MYRPVLVTPPAITPISLAEAKAHLRVSGSDEDTLIETYIGAAVAYLDGRAGIMRRALEEQSWRIDFDEFCQILRLPLDPVISVTSIVYRDSDGAESTVNASNYQLLADDKGGYVRFKDEFAYPGDLNQIAAVSVTFKAGWATTPAVPDDPEVEGDQSVPAKSTVPKNIKSALLLVVGDLYRNREASLDGLIKENPAVFNLIAPYRRITV